MDMVFFPSCISANESKLPKYTTKTTRGRRRKADNTCDGGIGGGLGGDASAQ